MKNIYSEFLKHKKQGKKSLAVLIDPDKTQELDLQIDLTHKLGADYIFVGGSLTINNNLSLVISSIKKKSKLPVILFPGNNAQISSKADGILLLSLISGRNPEYLIGQHVTAAPMLDKANIEILPTGYMLIENGKSTSVEYISQTKPIPRDKADIALATAMAGEMLGLKNIYLEAGSGAKHPVPDKMIKTLSQKLKIPLIVGGGIRNKKQLKKAFKAGADIVVVGTAIEKNDFKF